MILIQAKLSLQKITLGYNWSQFFTSHTRCLAAVKAAPGTQSINSNHEKSPLYLVFSSISGLLNEGTLHSGSEHQHPIYFTVILLQTESVIKSVVQLQSNLSVTHSGTIDAKSSNVSSVNPTLHRLHKQINLIMTSYSFAIRFSPHYQSAVILNTNKNKYDF